MNRQNKRTCFRLIFMTVLLVLFGAVLFWQTNEPNHAGGKGGPDAQQSTVEVKYSKKELTAEAERTYAVLKQHGIRVYGWSASVHENAVKIMVDPRDKARLAVTKDGAPNKHYYRLIRKSSAVPVYIGFEGPYVHPVGID